MTDRTWHQEHLRDAGQTADLDKKETVRHLCVMNNRRPKKSEPPNKENDPYLAKLYKIWSAILLMYHNFKDKKPIIEYQIPEEMVYAYPALEYINGMTERNREEARECYQGAVAKGQFMVFVSDARKRVLMAYMFPIQEPGVRRPERLC